MNRNEKNMHNLWTSYETWAVHNWLTKDEGKRRHWRDRARQTLDSNDEAENNCELTLRQLADEIQKSVEEECTIVRASLASDLINAALAEVDWFETAMALIHDAPPRTANHRGLFTLGMLLATPGALDQISATDRINALTRHASGDWGDACPDDKDENELSLKEGFRLFSIYHSSTGTTFWIITEADRSVTTILLPSEY